MHGVVMIFLVAMPMGAAFANYLLPLADRRERRGVPDDSTRFSFWVFLFGGLFS